VASERQITVGGVPIGGGAPVSVQSMTTTKTRDAAATLAQVARLREANVDLVRVAVPGIPDAEALPEIVAGAGVPIIADIHFNASLALRAMDAGVAAVRINPGNIGGPEKVEQVVRRAQETATPLRIGANSGSLPEHLRWTATSDPAGALVRAAMLARIPAGSRRLDRLHAHVERWGARFDGRLRICCVDRRSGRRVVFGAPGAPPADVADAVLASCAIPWVFEPVTIGGREYVDGGVWSVTNLDAAPAGRQTEVLCLDPVAGLGLARSRMGLIRQGFRVSAALEIQLLRRRGARVRHVAPDARVAEAMGPDLMDSRRAQDVLVAGHRQGRALAAGL
jgi:NTE family protein